MCNGCYGCYRLQRIVPSRDSCCDLLSFYYLCRTGNNLLRSRYSSSKLWFAFILLSLSYWKQQYAVSLYHGYVVICFHFTIFVVLETTSYRPNTWIRCCDLLSFYYLCRTGNNSHRNRHLHIPVVICFHFTIFVVLETTHFKKCVSFFLLWFAFILLYLL